MVHNSKRLAYFFHVCLIRRCPKTAIFSTFLKVALATSNFMNGDYNSQFMAEISVSMLKEIIALVRDYLSEPRK